MSQFNEDNTVEQLFIETLKKNGWKYIPAEQLDRELSDVMVKTPVRNAISCVSYQALHRYLQAQWQEETSVVWKQIKGTELQAKIR